jgi:hypothetical protein
MEFSRVGDGSLGFACGCLSGLAGDCDLRLAATGASRHRTLVDRVDEHWLAQESTYIHELDKKLHTAFPLTLIQRDNHLMVANQIYHLSLTELQRYYPTVIPVTYCRLNEVHAVDKVQ